MVKISLWDEDHARLMALESNLQTALKELKLEAEVDLNCEPPLIGRNGLVGKLPAVQFNGGWFWHHQQGKTISTQAFLALLKNPAILSLFQTGGAR